jgi:hypothetical protein
MPAVRVDPERGLAGRVHDDVVSLVPGLNEHAEG